MVHNVGRHFTLHHKNIHNPHQTIIALSTKAILTFFILRLGDTTTLVNVKQVR